jgi:hypothetical protein
MNFNFGNNVVLLNNIIENLHPNYYYSTMGANDGETINIEGGAEEPGT